MKFVFIVFAVITHIVGTHALVVPRQFPSFLSIVFSTIPVFKKGTDSRLGWGFRLGRHADFQMLVELGPQTYTQPLANQGDGGNNKRNTIDSLSNTLYAQRQKDKTGTAIGEIDDNSALKLKDLYWRKSDTETARKKFQSATAKKTR